MTPGEAGVIPSGDTAVTVEGDTIFALGNTHFVNSVTISGGLAVDGSVVMRNGAALG